MKKKGLELPVNMIIVIAIAVLVLVVIAAFFAGRFGGGAIDIQREQALSDACQKAFVGGCKLEVKDYNLKYNDPALGSEKTQVSVLDICGVKNLDSAQCRQRCGCPAP